MRRVGDEVDLDATEARAGVTGQGVRWVLIISLIAVVIALSAIWITGALSR
nr:hypothetical protein [uncultured Sphingomonas sp.]